MAEVIRISYGEVEKYCSHCEEWWPADNEFFAPHSGKRDGLQPWCRACMAEHDQRRDRSQRYTKNPSVTVTPARMPASAYVGGGGAENNRGEHAGS